MPTTPNSKLINSKSQAKPRIIQNSKLLIQNSVQRTAKFLFTHSFNVNKKRDCSVRTFYPQLSNLLLF